MQRMIRCTIAILVALGLCASATSCWAGFDEGLRAYERGDYAMALCEWRPLAEQGSASVQFNLGLIYHHGEGVPQDYTQAMQWYRRAAEQGHAGGQTSLGLMYGKGQGVPQDDAQAMQWYRRAAEQGYASAQHNLGVMYSKGQGVPQDNAQAYFWYTLAAADVPPDSARETVLWYRDLLATRLTPVQLAVARAHASIWQPKPETPSARPATVRLPLPVSAPPPVSTPSLRCDLLRKVQERLQAVGFSPGTLDGGLGAQTRSALRGFQQSKGLRATGEPDEQTLDTLGVR